MQQAQQISKKRFSRIADSNALHSVEWVQAQLTGAQRFSKNTRGYLWFLLALVKRGYASIADTQASIADAYFRATGGNKSVRSLQYAMQDLEEHGFISRSRYRVGDDHFRSVININVEAFSYWTREKTKKVLPMPTFQHFSSYAQNSRKDTGREIRPCDNSHFLLNENKEPRAHTRCKTNAKRFEFHPIIFTILWVLRIDRFSFKSNPSRFPIPQLAQTEINGETSATDIRWSKWVKEWQRMPIDEREGIARTSFIPRLKIGLDSPQKPKVVPMPKPKPIAYTINEIMEGEPATREEIAKLLAENGFRRRKVIDEVTPQKQPDKTLLDRREIDLLERARKTVEDRRKWMVEE